MEPQVPSWELRPATEADREFLFDLHRASIRPSVEALWGWDEEVQRDMFDERFAPETLAVIEHGGRPIGVLAVEDRPDEVFLGLVELLPEWQGRGIGGAIVRVEMSRAHAAGKPLTLRVLQTNPRARALYERLGLRVVGETAERVFMRADPPP